jgi:hypothetical protein
MSTSGYMIANVQGPKVCPHKVLEMKAPGAISVDKVIAAAPHQKPGTEIASCESNQRHLW